jgi:hypothetical protein
MGYLDIDFRLVLQRLLLVPKAAGAVGMLWKKHVRYI